jgi:hypothetical protein
MIAPALGALIYFSPSGNGVLATERIMLIQGADYAVRVFLIPSIYNSETRLGYPLFLSEYIKIPNGRVDDEVNFSPMKALFIHLIKIYFSGARIHFHPDGNAGHGWPPNVFEFWTIRDPCKALTCINYRFAFQGWASALIPPSYTYSQPITEMYSIENQISMEFVGDFIEAHPCALRAYGEHRGVGGNFGRIGAYSSGFVSLGEKINLDNRDNGENEGKNGQDASEGRYGIGRRPLPEGFWRFIAYCCAPALSVFPKCSA